MGKFFNTIQATHVDFIKKQYIFFVGIRAYEQEKNLVSIDGLLSDLGKK